MVIKLFFLKKLPTDLCKYFFPADLKRLYRTAGVENKPTIFLFNDTQVVDETFLEDINNILSSGEVPNLYKADEFEEVRTELADAAKKDGIQDTPESMFAYFIERVRTNLHVVLCMSPVGDPFRFVNDSLVIYDVLEMLPVNKYNRE